MRLLVLGGTRFLGRHVALQALAAGHQVTLLHRGQSGRDLFPQAEHRIADRNGAGLAAALQGGRWDAAIDTSAYFPRQVHAAADALTGRVAHYQLVSSISVYADPLPERGADEDTALATLADPTTEAVTGETYGGLKVLCEQAAQARFGPACCISRPGLIVGPFDPTGRYTWWVQRFLRAAAGDAAGGAPAEVLAPGDATGPVQFIDVRDLAAWLLRQAERGTAGVFNLNGPDHPGTWGGFLETARATLAPQARLAWVDAGFLAGEQVAPWSDLPVWLPAEHARMHRTHIGRALATGLVNRPWAETLADTAAWLRDAPAEMEKARPGVGLAPEREAALLAAFASLRGQ